MYIKLVLCATASSMNSKRKYCFQERHMAFLHLSNNALFTLWKMIHTTSELLIVTVNCNYNNNKYCCKIFVTSVANWNIFSSMYAVIGYIENTTSLVKSKSFLILAEHMEVPIFSCGWGPARGQLQSHGHMASASQDPLLTSQYSPAVPSLTNNCYQFTNLGGWPPPPWEWNPSPPNLWHKKRDNENLSFWPHRQTTSPVLVVYWICDSCLSQWYVK